MPEIQCSRFAINETPYCVWDWDITKCNLAFIESVDPRYFEHIAKVHAALLEGEDKQYAAIALRTAYSHGLETFFALLCAAIQAPDCVVGWMLKYWPNQLRDIVKKIQDRQPIYCKLGISPVSWTTLSNKINAFATGDPDKDSRIRSSYARLWSRLAGDLLNESLDKEYNNIKHGLRVGMGGFTLAMGFEEQPGVPAPPERMRSFGGSEFGTEFYFPENLHDKRNFRVKHQSMNWSPENLIHGLILVSWSIGNVISFLKIINGVEPSKVSFTWPSDDQQFDEPWKKQFSFATISMNSIIEESWIKPLTADEILSVYRETDDAPPEGFSEIPAE